MPKTYQHILTRKLQQFPLRRVANGVQQRKRVWDEKIGKVIVVGSPRFAHGMLGQPTVIAIGGRFVRSAHAGAESFRRPGDQRVNRGGRREAEISV
jgi:hypothetical protein